MTAEATTIQMDEPQPWVRNLRGENKTGYDEVRAENIKEFGEMFTRHLGKIMLSEDPQSVIDELVPFLAVFTRDTFEAGIQAGIEMSNDRVAAQRARDHSFMMNAVGNWAG